MFRDFVLSQGLTPGISRTVAFTYDRVGNLKSYNDGTTSATYDYDDAYKKTSETVNYGLFQKSHAYAFYRNGIKKTFTDPDNITYTFIYDANNQLTGIQIPGQGSITYTSYTWNQPASIALPGGSKKDYVYDQLMRIKQITVKDPAQNIIMNYQYTHDKMDNIIAKQTEHGNYQYSYDDLYRLTNETNPTNGTSFTYDPVGNRLTSSDITGTWTYNANNELQTYDNITYEYDANGNTTKKNNGTSVTNYIYDIENRLVQVIDGSGSVIANYYYDPFGRRLWKEVGGTKTYFLYADEGLVGECDSTGTVSKTYGYAPGSIWTTNTLFMRENNSYYFCQNDHLGTPQKLTATNGAVVWAATYMAFDNANVDTSSSVINNLRFAGQYNEQETGFHYNYHRYYNSGTGRYLTIDPIGFRGNDLYKDRWSSKVPKNYSSYYNPMVEMDLTPDSIGLEMEFNFYIYVANNPINFLDPYGLLRYNHPPPRTVPPPFLVQLRLYCMEVCLIRNLGISGGAEQTRHTTGSKHYTGQAADISYRMNPGLRNQRQRFLCCALSCGFKCALVEGDHYHLQTVRCLNDSRGRLPTACECLGLKK
jgi:RHS repeat-associated protein